MKNSRDADGPPVPAVVPPPTIYLTESPTAVVKHPPSGEAPRHVVLTREGHYFVATDCVDELARDLKLPVAQYDGPHRRRTTGSDLDPEHGLKYSREVSLQDPHIFALAGLEADAVDYLKLRGFRVVLDGDRPAVWPEVCAARYRRAGYGDFLELLRVCDRGLVRYDPARVDACRLIAAATIAWPEKATIVVVARDRAEVGRVTQKLGELGVELRPEGAASGPGIVVSTQYDLFGDRMRIRARTLLFFLEPDFCHVDLGILLAAPRARLFGLMPTDRQVPEDAEARMLDVFGRRGLRVPGSMTAREAGLRRHE